MTSPSARRAAYLFDRILLALATASALAACGSAVTTESLSESGTTRNNTVNRAPSIAGTPASAIEIGKTYRFTPSASDPDGDTLTFTGTNVPSWASLDAATGTLSGRPASGDTGTARNIVITVSDGSATDSLPAFSIEVRSAAAGNRAPEIAGTPAGAVQAGRLYEFLPSASDPDGDPLLFSIANKPTWATFRETDGLLSGRPQSTDIGTWEGIVIAASDGLAIAELPAFDIVVQASAVANRPPVIGGSPDASVTVGNAYAFTPAASDPDGDALTFSVGGLPAWAEFDPSSGAVAGTPTVDDIGRYSDIAITVTDGELSSALAAFSIDVIAVDPGNSPPQISGSPPAQVSVGQSYEFQPQASDADGDTLTFSIANQPGWSLFDTATGRLSGTPEAGDVGDYANIAITVSDGTDNAVLPPFGIAVLDTAGGSATISWQAPEQYKDGSPLAAADSYRVDYGTSAGNLDRSQTVSNGSATSVTIDDLSPGTWYFAVVVLDSLGAESERSATVSRQIQ